MFKGSVLYQMLFVGLMAPGTTLVQEKSEGAKVYKSAVPSVVWIHSRHGNSGVTGSGSLIDAERRLVLTNYHVVQETATATIYFPQFRDGHAIAEKDYYRDRAKRLAISGQVIAVDKKADLAVIQLEYLPKDHPALKLASASPDPGETVHAIGSAGKSDALFGYIKGSVRSVYKKDWKAELAPRKIASFQARIIETDSATNPGDSGGPLLNDKGELVGVTQGGATQAQLVSTFIDITEVRSLLDTRAVRELKTTKVTEPKERKPLAIADRAGIFKGDRLKSWNETLTSLFETDLDVMVETFKTAEVADEKLKELRGMKPAERSSFFREFTRERMTRNGHADIGIVVCNDPKSLYVELTNAAKKQFPDDFQKILVTTLMDGLKANKPDEALSEMLKLVQEKRIERKK